MKAAQALLAAGAAASPGDEFEHQGVSYQRQFMSHMTSSSPRGTGRIWISGGRFERRVDLTQLEENCFWSWALVNTLTETGVRIEELVEITTLALSVYKLPGSGEALPLLQIVPSKTDRERVLLVSPELAHVFALVKNRLKCCGFGGTFSMKNADVSSAMLADKTANICGTGAELCAGGDASCLLHIGGGLSRMESSVSTLHFAEILAATVENPVSVTRDVQLRNGKTAR